MKHFFTLIFLFIFFNINAQDIITLRDGHIIKAVVKEISKEIKYKKWANKTGPVYSILKKDVAQIKFINGLIEIYEEEKLPNVTTPVPPPVVQATPPPVVTPPSKIPVMSVPEPKAAPISTPPAPVRAETVQTSTQANQLPPPIQRRGYKSEGTAFEEGVSLLSADVTFPSSYTIYGLSYEYGISDDFGIGVSVAHASIPFYFYSYYGSYYDNLSVWGISANASYHLTKVMQTDRFDIIPTLSVGKAFASGIVTDVILSGQLGLRYFVTSKVGLGANLSFGISKSSTATLGISATFKLN